MSEDRWQDCRRIVRRIQVSGTLQLETPAHLGNGDAADLVDMPLLVDGVDGRAILTGSSLAGALRNYVREREHGYRANEGQDDLAELLFGDRHDGDQSMLIISDALSEHRGVELRDGVALDPKTRTAAADKKYDLALWQASMSFPLNMELLIPDRPADLEQQLRRGLADALEGLAQGEIALGMRKRRGLGRCLAQGWTVRDYDLTNPADLLAWLTRQPPADATAAPEPATNIRALLKAGSSADQRECLRLRANFHLDGSLLIRSGGDKPKAADMVHLKSQRGGRDVPILSGTSLAGALRARALRIAQTVGKPRLAHDFVDRLFGAQMVSAESQPNASRVWVEETEICAPVERVVTRLKIDRFTGGAYPAALFSQQPLFGAAGTEVTVRLAVENPTDADIGLVLLLLKDLWTGDLPLGGEASVGRGRLAGKWAEIELARKAPIAAEPAELKDSAFAPKTKTWRLEAAADGILLPAEAEQLQTYVAAFLSEVQHGIRR